MGIVFFTRCKTQRRIFRASDKSLHSRAYNSCLHSYIFTGYERTMYNPIWMKFPNWSPPSSRERKGAIFCTKLVLTILYAIWNCSSLSACYSRQWRPRRRALSWWCCWRDPSVVAQHFVLWWFCRCSSHLIPCLLPGMWNGPECSGSIWRGT